MAGEQITPTQAPLPQPTWNEITSDPPAPEAAPAVEESPAPAVAETAPAETPTLEPTAPLSAETESVRESESETTEPAPKKEVAPEKDEDVQEGDTPEILALPSKSASRRWAREQFKKAKTINTFLDLGQPIKSVGDELYQLSESRYFEHVDDIAKHHADYLTEKLFGLKTFDEAKAKLTTSAEQPSSTTTPQPKSTVALPTEAELDTLTNEQIVQRMAQVQQSAAEQAKAEMEAAMNAKVAAIQSQLDAVSGKIGTHEQQAREAQVAKIHDDLRASVLTVVDEVIRDSGLEDKPNDPPKIADLKAAARDMIQTKYDKAFDADEENLKVIDRVREYAKRLERHNAFREEDNLKVRLRAACEKIKQQREFKAIFDEIEAYANQSKAPTRTGGPAVPAPGAPAGITPKSPMNWDEAIQQASASS